MLEFPVEMEMHFSPLRSAMSSELLYADDYNDDENDAQNELVHSTSRTPYSYAQLCTVTYYLCTHVGAGHNIAPHISLVDARCDAPEKFSGN